MSRAALALALLGLLGIVGCARSSATPSLTPANATTTTTAKTEAAAIAPLPRSLDLHFLFDDQGLHIRIQAKGTPDELRTWTMGADDVQKLTVKDADGGHDIAFRSVAGKIELDAPKPHVVIAYDVAPKDVREDPRSTLVKAHFRVAGENVLALPASFDTRPFSLSLQMDGRAIEAPVMASSFGVATKELRRDLPRVVAGDLRRAAFIGGPGGHAVFDAPEGHDEVGWIGYSAFDPRPMAAEISVFRSTLSDHFRAGTWPQTMLVTVDERPRGHFRVTRRSGGLLIALSPSDPLDAALRLSIAHELVHAWIGDRLWIGDTRAGHEAATFWFHEGYARWVAREQLYRVGLLSPDEYASEVNRLYSIVTTSPHAQRPMSELVNDAKSAGVVPLIVARGALHATLVDARIRSAAARQSVKEERDVTLDHVLRGLLREVEGKPAGATRALPEEAFHSAIAAKMAGQGASASDFDELVLTGKRIALPPDALGGCFEPRENTYEIYDPGFDVAASRDQNKVTGVRANSAAAKAGLRDNDVVVHINEPKPDGGPLMKIELTRDGKPTTISYRPASGSKRGPGFRRRAGITDDACKKLALRK